MSKNLKILENLLKERILLDKYFNVKGYDLEIIRMFVIYRLRKL